MNTQQKFDWTDARVASLKELHALGLSAGQIAARIGGISRNAVIGKVRRLHLGPLNGAPVKTLMSNMRAAKAHKGKVAFTAEMVEKARIEWAAGKSADEIGKSIGKTAQQVLQYAAVHRDIFPKRYRGRPRAETHRQKAAQPEYIAPQFLVPPEGYDAERLEHAKELHEIEGRECRWPLNNGSPFAFCAADTEKGATYCVHHRMRARTKTQDLELG